MDMELNQLQQTVETWINEHGGYWEKFQILARLSEELGEISSALQRIEGLRPRKTDVDLEGEVGDLLFTLAAFANVNDIKLEDALRKVLAKYQIRDSHLWKEHNA